MPSPPLVFAIPVISKVLSTEWSVIENNLAATVRSALADDSALVVIAHHEKPSIPYWGNRVISVPVDFEKNTDPVKGSRDKQAKRRAIGAWIREKIGSAYVMLLDADDLVHRELAGYIRRDDNRGGYLINCGWRLDAHTGEMQFQDKNFHHSCGSCFVGFFEEEDLPRDPKNRQNFFSKVLKVRHREYFQIAEEHGRTVTAVPFRAVVYVTNHSESLRAMKTGQKRRELSTSKRVGLMDAEKILMNDYSWSSTER